MCRIRSLYGIKNMTHLQKPFIRFKEYTIFKTMRHLNLSTVILNVAANAPENFNLCN